MASKANTRMIAGNVTPLEYDLLKQLATDNGISMHKLISTTISALVTPGQATQSPSKPFKSLDLSNSTPNPENTQSHNVSTTDMTVDKIRVKLGL